MARKQPIGSLPDFDSDGLLPPGIHDAPLDDLKARFCRFQRSDRRVRLCERLDAFLGQLQQSRLDVELIVDGSFVTNAMEPNDIDLIMALPPDFDWTRELPPAEYNILSRNRVRKRYGLDLLVATKSSQAYQEALTYFQQVRNLPGRQKGIVRVLL